MNTMLNLEGKCETRSSNHILFRDSGKKNSALYNSENFDSYRIFYGSLNA